MRENQCEIFSGMKEVIIGVYVHRETWSTMVAMGFNGNSWRQHVLAYWEDISISLMYGTFLCLDNVGLTSTVATVGSWLLPQRD